MSTKTEQALIEVDSLTHRYDKKTLAVDGLSLAVPSGEVYGLLGHNGAGKTTTIKSLLGLQKPTGGSTRVLGLDSRKQGVEIRRRTGYVPEDLQAYDWMTVKETLWFVSRFHPTWDDALEAELVAGLELPLDRKLNALSRGMLAKLALACATAFRPEALVLDDPTSGLDALVRREFLARVIDVAAEDGRAVLFSSHVLDEVERLADVVGIVVNGRKIFERRVEDIQQSFRRLTLAGVKDEAVRDLTGVVSCQAESGTAVLVVDGWNVGGEEQVARCGATDVKVERLGLEDVFCEIVQASKLMSRAAEGVA